MVRCGVLQDDMSGQTNYAHRSAAEDAARSLAERYRKRTSRKQRRLVGHSRVSNWALDETYLQLGSGVIENLKPASKSSFLREDEVKVDRVRGLRERRNAQAAGQV